MLTPLATSRLSEIIEGPAARVGVRFEPGLVAKLAEDTGTGDGVPLLAFTLRLLYDAAGPGGVITHASYSALQVHDALSRHAEHTFAELRKLFPPELIMSTLLRLISLDANGQPIRRRVKREELTDNENVILHAFVDARLMVSSADAEGSIVEIAHEALLRGWPRFADAIESVREELRLGSAVERWALEWDAAGRDESYLLRGSRLDSARRLTESGRSANVLIQHFVTASVELFREHEEGSSHRHKPKPWASNSADTQSGPSMAAAIQAKRRSGEFDVFLCHHGTDKPAVMQIAEQLLALGVLPWLDEWELRPGLPWQVLLEEQISRIKAAAVFVGSDGVGPWQSIELRAFLQEFAERRLPVIPVLLANAPDKPELPIFLRAMTWVDFRLAKPNPTKRLVWGITGERPSERFES